jgi:hypothetical protein
VVKIALIITEIKVNANRNISTEIATPAIDWLASEIRKNAMIGMVTSSVKEKIITILIILITNRIPAISKLVTGFFLNNLHPCLTDSITP